LALRLLELGVGAHRLADRHPVPRTGRGTEELARCGGSLVVGEDTLAVRLPLVVGLPQRLDPVLACADIEPQHPAPFPILRPPLLAEMGTDHSRNDVVLEVEATPVCAALQSGA